MSPILSYGTTRLKPKPGIDTNLNTDTGIHVNTSQVDAQNGYNRNLIELEEASLKFSKRSKKTSENIILGLNQIKENTINSFQRIEKNDLEKELNLIFIQNKDDAVSCTKKWNEAIQNAKENPNSYLKPTEIEKFAREVTNPYELQLVKLSLTKNNRILQTNLINEIKTKQDNLMTCFTALESNDPELQADGFARFSKNLLDISNALETKNYTGGNVFDINDAQIVQQGNNNIIAQAYCRCRYARSQNIADKANFIDEVESGTHKINLAQFLHIPNELFKENEISQDSLGDFDFGNLPQETRYRIANELRMKYKAELKTIDKANRIHYAKEVTNGNYPKDKSNKEYQSCVSAYYDSLFENEITKIFNEQSQTAEDMQKKYARLSNIVCNFVDDFGYAPKRLTDNLSLTLMSQDLGAFSTACEIIDYLKNNDQDNVFEDKSFFKNVAIGLYGAKLLNNGIPPQQAYDMVHASLSATPEIKKRLNKEFEESVNTESRFDLKELAKEVAGHWYMRNDVPPGLPSIMMKEQAYSIAKGFYELTGDINSSYQATILLLRQKWGRTSINGTNMIVAYPPEKFYGNDIMTSDEMRNRLDQYVGNFADDKNVPYRADTVLVAADEQTYREIQANEPNVSYRVLFLNEFGTYDNTSDGEVIRVGANIWRTREDQWANGLDNISTTSILLKEYNDHIEKQKNLVAYEKYANNYSDFEKAKEKFESNTLTPQQDK